MKKYIKIVLLFFAISFFFDIFTGIFASDYDITNYDINVTIKKDGNIHVQENLVYDFDETMNGVYRDILYNYSFSGQKDDMNPTSRRYQAISINNIEVYTSNVSFDNLKKSEERNSGVVNGMSDVHIITRYTEDGRRVKFKVFSPAEEGKKKYVRYEYDIKGAVVKYKDMSEIYWNFIGGDWDVSLDNVNITIKFEEMRDISDVKVYPHSYASNVNYKKENSSGIVISCKHISSNTALDARVVFSNDFVPDEVIRKYENYDMQELEKIETNQAKKRKMYDISILAYFGIVLFGIFSFIFVVVKARKHYKKYMDGDMEYYQYIPDKLPLSKYGVLINGNLGGMHNGNMITATILDLVDRKYLIMDAQKKSKLHSTIKYNYYIKLNNKKDMKDLRPEEIRLITYIFNLKVGGYDDLITIGDKQVELNEQFKKLSKRYKQAEIYTKKSNELLSVTYNELYETKSGNLWKHFSCCLIILILALVINIFFVNPLNIDNKISAIAISFFLVMLYIFPLLAIIHVNTQIVRGEYKEEYDKLRGLRKYLKDYSLIKERYPIEIALWDKYLVFANIFGIADKVSKEFEEELLARGYDTEKISSNYSLMLLCHDIVYINSSATSAATGYSGSTGSSSSGGFSGGGSGGGGRRWWRRRRFLTSYL